MSEAAASLHAAPEETQAVEPGSYRDRNGLVFYRDGRVYRALGEEAARTWYRLENEAFFRALVSAGKVVETRTVARGAVPLPAGNWEAIVEHERVPFISYPYEWPFAMLRDAALLHLDLMEAALDADMILKDSSAYNVQWRGAAPVFIDIPSFEPLKRGEPWIGYRQFCELFLYPLMLQAYKGVDYRSWLRGRIDGIAAEDMRGLVSARDMLRPGVLLHVVAQAALQRRYSGGGTNMRGTLAEAGFEKSLIQRNVAKMRGLVAKLAPKVSKTEWSDYDRTHSYDEAEFQAKRDFVGRAAASRHWHRVWDLGCNTGTFSRIAAEHADHVVAMDGDWMAVEHLYSRLQDAPERRSILPLVVNLADPSPSQGWLGLERKALAERGRPDLTLCLALVHHIVIGANIPLKDFVAWLAGLGTALVIEFVGREDEMVRTLLANREDQYSDYDEASFEAILGAYFEIADRQPLKGGKRVIYFATPRV